MLARRATRSRSSARPRTSTARCAAIEASHPDVVLLDVRLQRSSGLDACRTIIDRHPEVSVVFLTVYEDEQYVFEALRAGRRGYMLKKATPEDIVRILEAVQAGDVVSTPRSAARSRCAPRPCGEAASGPARIWG